MQYILYLVPGIFATFLFEVLSKQKLSVFAFFKHWVIQMFFSNVISIGICHYLFPQQKNLSVLLSDPAFVLKYLCLLIAVSVTLGFVSFFLSKKVRIYTEQ
ncbi:MAG: hypothetical protein ACI4EK_02915 [Wujia sp.]